MAVPLDEFAESYLVKTPLLLVLDDWIRMDVFGNFCLFQDYAGSAFIEDFWPLCPIPKLPMQYFLRTCLACLVISVHPLTTAIRLLGDTLAIVSNHETINGMFIREYVCHVWPFYVIAKSRMSRSSRTLAWNILN